MFVVTPIYAAVLGLTLFVLSVRVIQIRRQDKVSLGDGGNDMLARRIRVQANFVEYAPMGVVLIALAEGAGAPSLALHVVGLSLTLGRVLHAAGLGTAEAPMLFRVGGMMLTFLALLLGSVLNLYAVIV